MADAKISALPSATTPLAGTEVLPIVQSGVTDKITVNNLAAGNLKSQSTTGVLQVSGPTAGTTRVMTTPDANFTAARTDAANSFTGDQTLSTGNLIQGTAAKGFNFTANTPAAGKTSQLLNWYEEGTFTPGQGSGLTLVGAFSSQGRYTRVGRLVTLHGYVAGATSVAVSAGGQVFTGAPFASGLSCAGSLAGYSNVGNSVCLITNGSTNLISNTAIAAASVLFFTITYSV